MGTTKGENMNITRTCPMTGRHNTLHVEGATPEGLKAWKNGALIQDALPEVSPENREFIMTGITPSMWSHLFGEDA